MTVYALGTPVVPFSPFYCARSLKKLTTRKKGTFVIKGLLRNLVRNIGPKMCYSRRWDCFDSAKALFQQQDASEEEIEEALVIIFALPSNNIFLIMIFQSAHGALHFQLLNTMKRMEFEIKRPHV